MSDSVDRVFVHALATVRRLPRTGSSRPPPSSRLRLYGLYKQSMEGDVLAILPRPTLPITSPDPSNLHNNNSAVHRYASRDVRTREAQAEIEKWDAWHACAGMSRTDAKREYISTLIETMKEYASGTAESRELVNELEFVWSQIRSQSGSGSDPDQDEALSGASQSPEGRKSNSKSSGRRSRPSVGTGNGSGQQQQQQHQGGRRSTGNIERSGSGSGSIQESTRRKSQEMRRKPTRTPSGLRVLPPVSQEDSNSINSRLDETRDADAEDEEALDSDDEQGDPDDTPPNTSSILPTDLVHLQKTLETHITHLRTELAALREQLSTNNLLSASTYTLGHHYYSLTRTQRFIHRVKLFLRTYTLVFVKQAVIQLGILGVVLLWGRCAGDPRVEKWVRGWVRKVRGEMGVWGKWLGGWLGWWVVEVLGRVKGWLVWPLRRIRRRT